MSFICSVNGEPLILSCSGSYGDDEAVLKWRKHANEVLTVVTEYFEKTKQKNMYEYLM